MRSEDTVSPTAERQTAQAIRKQQSGSHAGSSAGCNKPTRRLEAALDAGANALPYDELAPLSLHGRYFMWANVSRNETREWADNDTEHIDYCVFWQFHGRYTIVDLRSRQAARGDVEVGDDTCRTNSRSNTAADADNAGRFLAGILVDVVADSVTDAIKGTYPDPPPTSAHVDKSAEVLFRALVSSVDSGSQPCAVAMLVTRTPPTQLTGDFEVGFGPVLADVRRQQAAGHCGGE